MKNAVVYSSDDIKRILAEKHGVLTKNVIRNQYSYTVIVEDENEKTETGANE